MENENIATEDTSKNDMELAKRENAPAVADVSKEANLVSNTAPEDYELKSKPLFTDEGKDLNVERARNNIGLRKMNSDNINRENYVMTPLESPINEVKNHEEPKPEFSHLPLIPLALSPREVAGAVVLSGGDTHHNAKIADKLTEAVLAVHPVPGSNDVGIPHVGDDSGIPVAPYPMTKDLSPEENQRINMEQQERMKQNARTGDLGADAIQENDPPYDKTLFSDKDFPPLDNARFSGSH